MGKIIEDFLLQDELGAGAFGKVYKAFNIKTSQTVAIKVIPKEMFKSTPKLQECLENQIKVLNMMVENQHIISLIRAFRSSNNFYMVYQYCNGGTLESLLKEKKQLKEKEVHAFLLELVEAFKDLHKHQVLHRDLKPENILMHDGKLKLGDFGFSKTLLQGDSVTTTMIGSPIYMAPEVIRGQAYTSKADIWSLGVILYEMLYGVCPFESNSIAGLIMSLQNNHLNFPKTNNSVSTKTTGLMTKLLQKDQFKRISWEELFKQIEKYKEGDKKQTVTIKPPTVPISRPISNYLSYEEHKMTILPKAEKQFRRTASNEKSKPPLPPPSPRNNLKSLQSPRTNSTTNESKGSILDQPNLSSRFEVNRLLNNYSRQISSELIQLIPIPLTLTSSSKISQIQKSHKKLIQAGNLAVDIFIDDQKQGILYYYLILNKMKTQLSTLISTLHPQPHTNKSLQLLQMQLSLLQNQLSIFKDYLIFKSVIVDDILDIPTYLKIKQLGSVRKTYLWDEMFKYFTNNSSLYDNQHLKFNHSYTSKPSTKSSKDFHYEL